MMNSVKSKVFNFLTKAQKSDLCHFLAKFTKKHLSLSQIEIFDLFIEEETYYLEINSSRHPWIAEHLEEDSFHKELKYYIADQIKKYEMKELQKPYIEKQKLLQKEQRKNMQQQKMAKEPPTKAQMSYYKALCSKNKLSKDLIDIEKASKLDLRDAINWLLDENADKVTILSKLNEIIKAKEFN